MEPGHLRCRRRARRRPQGARAAGTSKQGTSDGRGEAAHRTAHRIREGGTGKHRATEGPPPPTATEHKQETPHIETCGQGARGTSPHSHCIGHRPPTVPQEPAQIVSGPAVHSRYRRQPVHGVQATRWFARAARTTVTAANDAHRDGWMRAGTAAPWPRRGPSRRGGGPDWEGCEGKSAARARCGEEQKAAASAAVSGKTAPSRKRHAETTACAGFWAMRARLPRCRLTRDNGGHGAPDTCADRRNALRAAPGAMGDPAGNSLNPKTSETAPRGDDHRDPPKPSTSATVRPIEATPRSRSRPAPHRGRWQSRSRPAPHRGRWQSRSRPAPHRGRWQSRSRPAPHRGRWQSRSEASRASSCRTPGGRNGGGWGRIGDARGSGNAQQSVCGPCGWRRPGRAEQPTQQQRVARIFGPLGRTTTGPIDAR